MTSEEAENLELFCIRAAQASARDHRERELVAKWKNRRTQ